jgi:hypothetical protein
MDILLITGGLGLLGYLINDQKQKYSDEYNNNDDIIKIKKYNTSDHDIYNNVFQTQLNKPYDIEKYNLYSDSLKPDTMLVNRIWRLLNDKEKNEKINKNVNDAINKDLNNLKNIKYNNIEPMMNINNNYNDNFSQSDNDSTFSDNYMHKKYLNDGNIKKINENNYISDDNSSYETDMNINTHVLNKQEKFMDDVITSLSGDFQSDDDIEYDNPKNEFEKQFEELKFDHKGIPGTMPPDRKMLKPFNEKMKVISESEFIPDCDGRYGVTSDMSHGNMVPFFKSTTYGYNPMRDTQMENYATRNIELFTGSDQNPQFKHKQEVKTLFPTEMGRVESVTGMPNFSDYFESRYIPSQSRNGERPVQPIRDTPGLDLGYNQIANGNNMYRALPKNVDQLRTANNPKISYEQPVIPGQMGNKRRIMGKQVQQGPDRYYYNSPDSMLPQVGDFEAPALYGKYIIDPTNRAMNPSNDYTGPLTSQVQKSTPQYLQGEFKNPFKKTFETDGPRNVQYDTRGQIINQESWTPSETNRQTVNYGDQYIGGAGLNKTQNYLFNAENAINDPTNRDITQEGQVTNITGNYKSVPLINFLNYIPDVTRKQIMIEDNGRKSLTNVSNSIKGYLFNSINAIPDETLRSILTDKVIIANTKGNSERGYLFNTANNITDQNARNMSEDNLILGNLSNHEKSYLFNYMNNIPDVNLRNIINTVYSSGGLNIKGNHDQSYLIDYNNTIPDITTKEMTENNLLLGTATPIQKKGYLINYDNSIPDTTLNELTEQNTNILNFKGNHIKEYMFNYENGITEQTLRNLVENITQLGNFTGNHTGGYLINYINSIPNTTLKELTENTTDLANINPLKMKGYLINYINSIPDSTKREITENQKIVIGTKGNHTQNQFFNYDNGIPDPTNRNQTENQKNIIGMKGNQSKNQFFNYDNGIPDPTNRNQTENQKNVTGIGSAFSKEYIFNYENGIPDATIRSQTENKNNIIGQKGQGTQNRSRLDYNNAILNVEKEVIARGRAPVVVKNNLGPTPVFTQYVFNDDNASERNTYCGTIQEGSIQNELYSFK